MFSKVGQRFVLLVRQNISSANRYKHGIFRNVIDTFENEEDYMKYMENEKAKKREKNTKKVAYQPKNEQKLKKDESHENIDVEFNMYSDIPKEILDLKFLKPNPARVGSFSNMMLNMKSRSYRERHETCLLEGKFLIRDAMRSGMFIRSLYFSRLQNLVGFPVDVLRKTNLVKVGFAEIQQASEVKIQSEGLLAIASKQDDMTRRKVIEARDALMHGSNEKILPVTLICDNVRDAGNMGTLLRSAMAAGCEQVLTTTGCTDIWGSKVIRAGAGAHFRIPIVQSLTWQEITTRMSHLDVRRILLSHHSSENVRLSTMLPNLTENTKDSKFYDNLTKNIELDNDNDITNDDFKNVIFESKPYYDVTYFDKGHTVIVIGGEVHGVSLDACLYALETTLSDKLNVERSKALVNIPMSKGSECVNTAVAGSVILFEARRQMLSKK